MPKRAEWTDRCLDDRGPGDAAPKGSIRQDAIAREACGCDARGLRSRDTRVPANRRGIAGVSRADRSARARSPRAVGIM